MLVAGVDGARHRQQRGWAVVRLRDGRLDEVRFEPTMTDVLRACADAAIVLVDAPIGHEDPEGARGGKRAADVAARDYLGPARASVFLVPPPRVLAAVDFGAAHEEAADLGWKPSVQAWRMREAWLEVEEAAARDARVREGHPEVSFRRLQVAQGSAKPLPSKKTQDGFVGRLELLHKAGLRPARSFGGVGVVGPDDVLDATVLAWSADRVARGHAQTLPAVDVPTDPRTGRPVAIWS